VFFYCPTEWLLSQLKYQTLSFTLSDVSELQHKSQSIIPLVGCDVHRQNAEPHVTILVTRVLCKHVMADAGRTMKAGTTCRSYDYDEIRVRFKVMLKIRSVPVTSTHCSSQETIPCIDVKKRSRKNKKR